MTDVVKFEICSVVIYSAKMDFTLPQMDRRAQELLAQAEKCRKEAQTLADEAEARRNRNLISHDVVIGCAANLLLADRQTLRELAHKKDGCRCHAIRARRRAEKEVG